MAFGETRRVEWGDCDDAGIVFYPNYFRWMDGTFHAACLTAGYDQRVLRSRFGLLGTPLVDAQARFLAPATFGQTLDITLTVSDWGQSSFTLAYHFTRDRKSVIEGREIRVFVRRDGEGELLKAMVPEAFKDAFSAL